MATKSESGSFFRQLFGLKRKNREQQVAKAREKHGLSKDFEVNESMFDADYDAINKSLDEAGDLAGQEEGTAFTTGKNNRLMIHQNVMVNFEKMIGVSGKEKNSANMQNILTALKPYNDPLTGRLWYREYANSGSDARSGKSIVGAILSTVSGIQEACNSYIQKSHPWTSTGKERKMLVMALEREATSQKIFLERLMKRDEDNQIFTDFYWRGANGNIAQMISFLGQNEIFYRNGAEDEDAQ